MWIIRSGSDLQRGFRCETRAKLKFVLAGIDVAVDELLRIRVHNVEWKCSDR